MARRHSILKTSGYLDHLFTRGMRHPFLFRGRPVDDAWVIGRIEELATGKSPRRAAINGTIRYRDLCSGKRQVVTLATPSDAHP